MKQSCVVLRSDSGSRLGSGDGLEVSVLVVGKIFLILVLGGPLSLLGKGVDARI